MSRIHEALKRAEKEKELGLFKTAGEHDAATGGEPPEGRALVGAAAVAGAAAAAADSVVSKTVAEQTNEWSFSAITTRCRQEAWSPTPSNMPFFNSANDSTVAIEEFRTLRSRLYQLRQKQRLQKLLVASALPGEGKSFVAANLASVIARQQGGRVLLIDADLRRPSLHQVLGAPREPGLTDYLVGEADENAILQRGPVKNMLFLPSGRQAANPAELIANGRIRTLLQKIAPAFQWVIIDSPPALPVSDSAVLADNCDGILLVVRSGATPADAARKTCQEFAGRPLLGVVLNRVPPQEARRAGYGVYRYDGKDIPRKG